MLLFFQIMVWCVMAGLGLYVYATWRFEAKVKEKCPPSGKHGTCCLFWALWYTGHMSPLPIYPLGTVPHCRCQFRFN